MIQHPDPEYQPQSPLVVRYARATQQPFLGCTHFPHCRYTTPFEAAIEAAVADLKQDYLWAWQELARVKQQAAFWQQQAHQRTLPRQDGAVRDRVDREL